MANAGRLVAFAGVFVFGGLGGAAALHFATARAHESDPTTKAAAAQMQLRRFALNPHAQDDAVSAATESAAFEETNAAREGAPSEAEGLPLADVLSGLENAYQASLRSVAATPEEAPREVAAAPVEPPAAPLEEHDDEALPAPVAAATPQRAQQVEQPRVAVQAGDVDQINVSPGTVNVNHVTVTHVTEAPTNQISVVALPAYMPFGYAAVPPGVVAAEGTPRAYGRASTLPPGKRYDSLKPPPGRDSPMFPAHASASLGPIFGGLP